MQKCSEMLNLTTVEELSSEETEEIIIMEYFYDVMILKILNSLITLYSMTNWATIICKQHECTCLCF